MRYLALERALPTLPRSDYSDLLQREAAAVWRLQTAGLIRDISFTHPERHAVLVLECPSLAAARAHLAELPLVRAGLIEFQLHELRPYDGYERLFAPGYDRAERTADHPEY
jgi:hypothetical protein